MVLDQVRDSPILTRAGGDGKVRSTRTSYRKPREGRAREVPMLLDLRRQTRGPNQIKLWKRLVRRAERLCDEGAK